MLVYSGSHSDYTTTFELRIHLSIVKIIVGLGVATCLRAILLHVGRRDTDDFTAYIFQNLGPLILVLSDFKGNNICLVFHSPKTSDELPGDDEDRRGPIEDAKQVDQDVDVAIVRAYLGWLLENRNFKLFDAVMSYCLHWKMACRKCLDKRINDRVTRAITVPSGK